MEVPELWFLILHMIKGNLHTQASAKLLEVCACARARVCARMCARGCVRARVCACGCARAGVHVHVHVLVLAVTHACTSLGNHVRARGCRV